MENILHSTLLMGYLAEDHSVGRKIKIFLRLKADGKIVVIDTSVASFAKVVCLNKS